MQPHNFSMNQTGTASMIGGFKTNIGYFNKNKTFDIQKPIRNL